MANPKGKTQKRQKQRGSANFDWKLRLGMRGFRHRQLPPLAQTQVSRDHFVCVALYLLPL
jgi:hypothetical protein